jgi:hypothetical protein
MTKQFSLFFFFVFFTTCIFAQQKALPVISVKNINNKIIISWVNDYTKPITTLNIQRSFDSLRNYKTAGSVLSPQSRENGYADVTAPYNKMYYRVFVAFEGGSYVYSKIMRPIKDTSKFTVNTDEQFPWLNAVSDTGLIAPPIKTTTPAYPSSNIFTAKDNNVVIHLYDATTKKYSVKFFDETDKLLFELKKVKEDYLIIEKVNFVRTGWYHFEIYEDGELMEKNKFQITKEAKKL